MEHLHYRSTNDHYDVICKPPFHCFPNIQCQATVVEWPPSEFVPFFCIYRKGGKTLQYVFLAYILK